MVLTEVTSTVASVHSVKVALRALRLWKSKQHDYPAKSDLIGENKNGSPFELPFFSTKERWRKIGYCTFTFSVTLYSLPCVSHA
jgi:hypothetical protein